MKIQGALARTAVILVLAASGMVAFATIAPGPQMNAPFQSTASIETMPISADQVLPAPMSYIREERFQRGETLPGLLARLGVGETEVPRLARLRALQQLRSRMLVRAGKVLAAEFTNQGKTYRAVYFGKGYYTPEGKNLRKAFLRSPLEFSRISSGFGMRKHPMHKSWMAHKGIDYAAPTGTRVRAVGDGIVEFAGVKGGYGNVVILRHHGQYTTTYAHLSRFAQGVKRGAHIAQSDPVGFVGQTGWATGPHLHYEFRVAREARNPFSLAMPSALPVAAQELPEFRSQAAAFISQLELLANSNLAMLE